MFRDGWQAEQGRTRIGEASVASLVVMLDATRMEAFLKPRQRVRGRQPGIHHKIADGVPGR
jgi:hypothetical protein